VGAGGGVAIVDEEERVSRRDIRDLI